MANTEDIMVRTQKNGVVVHKHEGANGWHDPSRKHEGAETTQKGHLHLNKAKLAKPKGFDELTPEEQAQYAEALGGKTFWVYAGKKEAVVNEAEAAEAQDFKNDVVAEAEALLAEVQEP